MAVPDYQSLMRPLLELASDGREHTLREAIETLAQRLSLTEEDRRELIPSGQEPKFDNRVGWARTYLGKAGLLESTGRARFRITERGLDVVRNGPPLVNTKYLAQFQEFIEFKQRHLTKSNDDRRGGQTTPIATSRPNNGGQLTVSQEVLDVVELRETPQETLETSYQLLRRNLAEELLDRVKASSPRFFERLVVDLLVRMGYGGSRKDAGQAVGQSGDGGIDGIIKEDRLGLDVVYIQAKRWEGTVGRPIVQGFAGSLEGQRARKGVLITTSQFSQDAKEYVSRIEKKIVLIDGEQLAQYMIDFGVGVAEEATYVIKKVDSDYFGDE